MGQKELIAKNSSCEGSVGSLSQQLSSAIVDLFTFKADLRPIHALLCYPLCMRPLKSLSFDAVRCLLSRTFHQMPDRRAPERLRFSMHDTLMSGFAIFFFQHPSLLKFQETMKLKRKQSNLERLFGTHSVPSDTQMREILDEAPTEPLRHLIALLFERVRRAGWAQRFLTRVGEQDYYTVVLDGSEYFHSTKINCPSCLRRTRGATTHYSHTTVAATLVKASSHQILPLDVEAVSNEDGTQKQDCEINAAKRLIVRLRREHPRMKMIIGGDDLYAHEPFVELLQQNKFRYVLVAKPDSHKELFEWVEELERIGEIERGRFEEGSGPKSKRREVEYRIARQVPLSGTRKVSVTFVEAWVRNDRGELLYHNSWVTDLEVSQETVRTIISIGRSRWKIENEQFNVHKNCGYELEHNYGHGQKRLSEVMYLLNLLAFITHQILGMGDRLYQRARQRDTLRELWNGLRTVMRLLEVESWRAMLEKWLEDEAELSP